MSDSDELLTVREVSTRLKVGEETVRRWIRARRIRAVTLGGEKIGYRIPTSEVDRLIASSSSSGADKRTEGS